MKKAGGERGALDRLSQVSAKARGLTERSESCSVSVTCSTMDSAAWGRSGTYSARSREVLTKRASTLSRFRQTPAESGQHT